MGFAALGNMHALSKRNDDPEHASRPFDETATASSTARVPASWSSSRPSTP